MDSPIRTSPWRDTLLCCPAQRLAQASQTPQLLYIRNTPYYFALFFKIHPYSRTHNCSCTYRLGLSSPQTLLKLAVLLNNQGCSLQASALNRSTMLLHVLVKIATMYPGSIALVLTN